MTKESNKTNPLIQVLVLKQTQYAQETCTTCTSFILIETRHYKLIETSFFPLTKELSIINTQCKQIFIRCNFQLLN